MAARWTIAPLISTFRARSGDDERTGSYPGQVWLWLYTFWYQVQIGGLSTSPNVDAIVMAIMACSARLHPGSVPSGNPLDPATHPGL